MQKINILYIDDNLDLETTSYLDDEYINERVTIEYDEITFGKEDNYEKLLNDQRVREANIIVIDSSLFEESTMENMFTGEEFKIIFKHYFPYAEVIIVSQNPENNLEYGIVEKYKARKGTESSKDYYDEKLKPILDDYIKRIVELRNILKKIEKNETLDKVLINKIENSLEGIVEYQQLTSKDIDKLINKFEKLEQAIKCQD
ncbi:MAG: hypothetical protein ACRC6A_03685 [Fusobacteriaceae bacterium]